MFDFESELASIALTRINEHREDTIANALELLRAEGYRISKPKTPKKPKAETPKLNAVGKPYSPSYDPNYKMKYKAGSTVHLFKPYNGCMRWVKAEPYKCPLDIAA